MENVKVPAESVGRSLAAARPQRQGRYDQIQRGGGLDNQTHKTSKRTLSKLANLRKGPEEDTLLV